MNIPQILDRKTASALAVEGETHMVRVILRKVANSGPYRYRAPRRQYIFERDGTLCAHILDIPLSVWMAGLFPGAYRDNNSVAHDLQPTVALPLVILVLPIAAPAPEVSSKEQSSLEPSVNGMLGTLSQLLSKLGAPRIMHEAVEVMKAGDESEFAAFVGSIVKQATPDEDDEQEEPQPSESPAAGDLREGSETESVQRGEKPNGESSDNGLPGEEQKTDAPSPTAKQTDAPQSPGNTPEQANDSPPKTEKKSATPAAQRMREMRARKKAEAEAAGSKNSSIEPPASEK